MTYFMDVGTFHKKFNLQYVDSSSGRDWDQPQLVPQLLDDNTALYRQTFMLEELVEFARAVERDDLPGAADALVDLVYVALGTAHLMHLPWQALWNEVHAANMKKERGPTEARGHHILDVRKPVDWEPPDIEGVLREAGWKDE